MKYSPASKGEKEQGLKRDGCVSPAACRGCAPNQRQMHRNPRHQRCAILRERSPMREQPLCAFADISWKEQGEIRALREERTREEAKGW